MLNTRDEALALLRQYNKEPFHLLHALTVEGVMAWYAGELGYGDQADFWSMAGLLHDIDFEQWPDQHCRKAPELLREAGADEALIHAVVCHGFGLCSDVEPVHVMEKVLFAAGCSRDVISQGAERLGWDLDVLLERTILAMRSCEERVSGEMAALAEAQ